MGKNQNLIFTILTCIQIVNCLNLGKLTLGTNSSSNVVQLHSNNPLRPNDLLEATFGNISISNTTAKSSKVVEVKFNRENTQAVVEEILSDENVAEYSLIWTNGKPNEEFCITLGHQQWYSSFEEKKQRWPIDKTANFGPVDFSTNDFFQRHIGGIVENLWLASSGFAVFVDRSTPLFIRQENKNGNQRLCFSVNYHEYPYDVSDVEPQLIVHLISAKDVKEAYRYSAGKWIRKPEGIPDERMFKSPIWYDIFF